MLVICGVGDIHECFECTNVTMPECWLFVLVGPMPVFKYKTSPQLNIVLGGGDQCPNVLSAKRPKHLNVGYSDVTFFT